MNHLSKIPDSENENEAKEENIQIEEFKTPLLPIDGMPEFIQNFILTMTGIYRTPRDYWAGAVIISTALAIGDKMELSTKYKNNPILWGVFVGDVSNGKTEPLSLCLRFFQNTDSKNIKEYKIALAEYERTSKLSTTELAEEGIDKRPIRPKSFQYVLIDYTPEALAEAHELNSRGLMIYRDELKGMLDDFGRYTKSGEESTMLMMWSQQPVKFNRKSSEVLEIGKPCVLVAGGIHRELLHTLASGNRAENGFMARMISFFPDNTEKQPYNNAIPDEDLLRSWSDYLKKLTEITEPLHLILLDSSSKLYEEWYNENVKFINEETSPYLKGVYGKLDIILLRIAVVMRGMNYINEGVATPGILPREMKAAIEITEYFRATALKVYAQIYGGKGNGRFEKADVALYLMKNTGLSKSKIAEILGTSRPQLDRIQKKTEAKLPTVFKLNKDEAKIPTVVKRPK